jgi:hypothetical protein
MTSNRIAEWLKRANEIADKPFDYERAFILVRDIKESGLDLGSTVSDAYMGLQGFAGLRDLAPALIEHAGNLFAPVRNMLRQAVHGQRLNHREGG